MKLYKIDFTNTIGDYMVTVPTDSQFLIGISNGDSEADVELLDGETELTPEDDKIGAYTVFKFETGGTPSDKHYKAVITGTNNAYQQKIDLVVHVMVSTVAYRDIDTGVLADEVVNLVEESGVFQTTLKPLKLETSEYGTYIDIDDTNFMDVERTIFEIGTTDAQVTSKTMTANIYPADFPVETGSTQMFKLNLKINCLGDAVSLPDGLIFINITNGENIITLDASDFYVSYVSGPTALSTVIGDSTGVSLLVELTFDSTGGYAEIKGSKYIN